MSFLFNNDIKYEQNSDAVDATGRLRVSQPVLLFSAEFLNDIRSEFWDTSISGNGAVSHNTNFSGVAMDLSTTSGDEVVRQTKTDFRYISGNGVIASTAFIWPSAKTGLRTRTGQFNINNGFFIERNDTNVRFVRRSNSTGSVIDNVIEQNNWNVDPLDGTGPSGITLDLSKFQVFVVSYEWYGGGTIRYGFRLGGKNLYCHVEHIANIQPYPSLSRPVLPIRYEATNTAPTGSSSEIIQMGSSVVREGEKETPNILLRTASRDNSVVKLTTDYKPLLTIRLDSSFLQGQIKPNSIQVSNIGSSTIQWQLVKGATLDSSNYVNVSTAVEKNEDATVATGGVVLDSGYSEPGNDRKISFSEESLISLGSDLSGVSETITIRAKVLYQSTDATATISWKELS